MPLTDRQIRNLKPSASPRKISDGAGLYIHVAATGSKLFRMAYRFQKKQRVLSFGAYPAVSLLDARRMRDEAKAVLAAGRDPAHHRAAQKREAEDAAANTFASLAAEMLQKSRPLAAPTLAKKRWLIDLAGGDLGARPIKTITAPDILATLRRVEAKGNLETARRLRAVVSQVFRYASAAAVAKHDPTSALRGALQPPTVIHRAAITHRAKVGGLMQSVWSYEGLPDTRAALQLLALLYPRPGELRGARWAEFDLDRAEWTIPAERTKMRRAHRKPLSTASAFILEDCRRRRSGSDFLFPAANSSGRTMSENTLNSALRRLGYDARQATAHGFRATASSLLNEAGRWSPDAIEAELGHAERNDVRRAYHRALYWDERRLMAEWWASEIETLRSAVAAS